MRSTISAALVELGDEIEHAVARELSAPRSAGSRAKRTRSRGRTLATLALVGALLTGLATTAGAQYTSRLLDQIAIFQHPKAADEPAEPDDVDGVFTLMTDVPLPAWAKSLASGDPSGDKRLLFAKRIDGEDVQIWATATDKGRVCWQVRRNVEGARNANSEGGSCFSEFGGEWPASSLEVKDDSDRRVRVFGIVPVGAAVTVTTPSGEHEVDLENQAYYWSSATSDTPSKITIRLESGRTVSRGISFDAQTVSRDISLIR